MLTISTQSYVCTFRLHDAVDLQECVCKKRKFCYAGSERDDLGYAEEQEATFLALRSAAPGPTWLGPLLLLAALLRVIVE